MKRHSEDEDSMKRHSEDEDSTRHPDTDKGATAASTAEQQTEADRLVELAKQQTEAARFAELRTVMTDRLRELATNLTGFQQSLNSANAAMKEFQQYAREVNVQNE